MDPFGPSLHSLTEMQNTCDPMGEAHNLDRITIDPDDLQAEACQRAKSQLCERDSEVTTLKQAIQKLQKEAYDQDKKINGISSNWKIETAYLQTQVLLLRAKLDSRDSKLAKTKEILRETERVLRERDGKLEKIETALQRVVKEHGSQVTNSHIMGSNLTRALEEKLDLAAKVNALSNVHKDIEEQRERVLLLARHLQAEKDESNQLSQKVKVMKDVHQDNLEQRERVKTLTNALQAEQRETAKLREENKVLIEPQTRFTQALESDNEEEISYLRAKLAGSKVLYSQLQSNHEKLVKQLQETMSENSVLTDKLAGSKVLELELRDTIRIYVCQVGESSKACSIDRLRLLEFERTIQIHENFIEHLKGINKKCAGELSQALDKLEKEATAYAELQEKNSILLRDCIDHEGTISTMQEEAAKVDLMTKWYRLHKDSDMVTYLGLDGELESLITQHTILIAKCEFQAEELVANRTTIALLRDKNLVANQERQAAVSAKELQDKEFMQMKGQLEGLSDSTYTYYDVAKKDRKVAKSKDEYQAEEIERLERLVQELEDTADTTKRELEAMKSGLSDLKYQAEDITKDRDLQVQQNRSLAAEIDRIKEELTNIEDSGRHLIRKFMDKNAIINGLENAVNTLHRDRNASAREYLILEHTVSSLESKLQKQAREFEQETAALEREFNSCKAILQKKANESNAHADKLEDDVELLEQRLKRAKRDAKDQRRRFETQRDLYNELDARMKNISCELTKNTISLRNENYAYKKRVEQLEDRYEDKNWEFDVSKLDTLAEGVEDTGDDRLSDAEMESVSGDAESSKPEDSGPGDSESSVPEESGFGDNDSDDESSGTDVESGSDVNMSSNLGVEINSDSDLLSGLGVETGSDSSVA